MPPCLPQTDPKPVDRSNDLAATSARYQWSSAIVPGLQMLADVPHSQAFSVKYTLERAEHVAALVPNLTLLTARQLLDPLNGIDDFEDMYPTLRRPAVLKEFRKDESFAEQRLSGANPFSIRQVTAASPLPAYSIVADTHIVEALGSGNSLAAAVATGDLYVVDHIAVWNGQHGGTFQGARKFGPEALGLFMWRQTGVGDRGYLSPIAIQLGRPPGPLTPPGTPLPVVVTPKSRISGQWTLAKTCFQIADANVHEMVMHLGRTHFAMEPFGVATSRNLADAHPLKVLLQPHLRFMLFNNSLGVKKLINSEGPVDSLMAGTLKDSIDLSVAAARSFNVVTSALPAELQARGVHDTLTLPHYPYRDDGMLLWNAIDAYVTAYLNLYYSAPADITADFELQAWAADLNARCPWLGVPASIPGLAALIPIITVVIYTCSAAHSAVNYPQWDYMGFVPNMPLAGYADFREQLLRPFDEADYMKLLPPNGPTVKQLSVMHVLASYRYDRLGYYENPFVDPAAQKVNDDFCAALSKIEIEIDDRNTRRRVVYPYLKPSLVLNSISI